MNTPESIAAANEILTQGLELLFDLDDRSYSRSAGEPVQASIGQHYGQVLDHFLALINALINGVPRESDCGFRTRSPRIEKRIEKEVHFATIATCDILRALKRYSEGQAEHPGEGILSAGYSASKAASFRSNISGEIAYCVGQAIERYSRIRLLCARFGLSVPESFGIMPSVVESRFAMAAV